MSSEAQPRVPHAVIQDFASAATRLHAIGMDWLTGQFKPGDLTDAAQTLERLRGLLAELPEPGDGSLSQSDLDVTA